MLCGISSVGAYPHSSNDFQRIIHRLQVVPRIKKARDVTHLLSLYSTLKTFLGGSPFCFPHLTCSGILHRVEQRLK